MNVFRLILLVLACELVIACTIIMIDDSDDADVKLFSETDAGMLRVQEK